MLDTLDAALYYPANDHAYFFRGSFYVKYKPGEGVVPFNGKILRHIGVDGWKSFPDDFKDGIDAALHYPSLNAAYFFKEDKYVKYKPGDGLQPMSNGNTIRRIGIDGWKSLPGSFRSGIDAAIYYRSLSHAYFFKGDKYVKYKPGEGVVPFNGSKTRKLGIDGWKELPAHFRDGLDAALEYQANDSTYFFCGREYARWEPGEGLNPRYPRRFGLLHGSNVVNTGRGGWFGLSQLIAGPIVGRVTSSSAAIWIWIASREALDGIALTVNGQSHQFDVSIAGGDVLNCGIDSVWCGSRIAVLSLDSLDPEIEYEVKLGLDGTELDRVTFTTPAEAGDSGSVAFVFGSCSDMSQYSDVPAFEGMAAAQPDFAIMAGDNCYYVHGERRTGRTGPQPRDWESVTRMLLRQVQARNHPQFKKLSLNAPLFSTWDDHDFGYNNAAGADRHDYWVGRKTAAAVFRAMWPNAYAKSGRRRVNHSFRWGPVEVFVSDTRYHKKTSANRMWGNAQRDWLLDGLAASNAPVKILVTATQFLFNRSDQEGHAREAPAERETLLDAMADGDLSGPLLILSGDVHYSEVMRLPGNGPVKLLEFTSSPMRRDVSGSPKSEKTPGSRVWAAKRDGFGHVEIDVTGVLEDGTVQGTIVLEARRASGAIVKAGGKDCRTTWNLATGAIT